MCILLFLCCIWPFKSSLGKLVNIEARESSLCSEACVVSAFMLRSLIGCVSLVYGLKYRSLVVLPQDPPATLAPPPPAAQHHSLKNLHLPHTPHVSSVQFKSGFTMFSLPTPHPTPTPCLYPCRGHGQL